MWVMDWRESGGQAKVNTQSEMDEASGIAGFVVCPLGSKRVLWNFSASRSTGTPNWKAMETRMAMVSISPDMVEPCLAILMNNSPGFSSS